MNTLIIVFWVVLLSMVLGVFFCRSTDKKCLSNESKKYKKIGQLFTTSEKRFYQALIEAVDDDVIVMGKVRVADLITPSNGKDNKQWWALFNKISRKHFDFVLIRNKTLSPICAIELNDKTHKEKHRQERDEFLLEACNSANFKLIFIQAQSAYNITSIRKAIRER